MADRRAERKYTDPELRARIKRDLQRSSKGGRRGTWSARKSQLLVQEYERRGGGYRGGKDEAARSLESWSAQDWRTQEGTTRARKRGAVNRYLPREAWRRLTPTQRREAERTKRRAERQGSARVSWPPAVKRVMRELDDERTRATRAELYERARELDVAGRSRMNKAELHQAVADAEARRKAPARRRSRARP